ncbi:hypothetical protein [Flavobacterium psychrophilum]|uniref:hypothetical protein n=1 Tax=Flavobacterium psychrophilum TaxID=96345 RepID=UPI001D087E0A|nr:hypothetical protein [Flavobacterium psychrophilum]MCB6089505.1 hypothetical protein [Flavobacterium psychrophilum]
MLVQKLRIYAMIMRLRELEEERQSRIRERFMKPFLPEPIMITALKAFPEPKAWFDKNGKP